MKRSIYKGYVFLFLLSAFSCRNQNYRTPVVAIEKEKDGVSAGQRTLLENMNSDEEYAKKVFNSFGKDISNQNEDRNSTIKYLEKRFSNANSH
jgi:hypothetical protein